MSLMTRRILPGYPAGMAISVGYLALLLLVPLAAAVLKATSLSWDQFLAAVLTRRALFAYVVTFGASGIAAIVNVVLGLMLAWVLVRYEFPGRRLLDAMIDLPFALPTAVAGLVFAGLFVKNGWYGQFLVPLGIQGAYSRLGVVFVLVFVGLPFVVRTVQPVLESLEGDVEESAASLGASRLQTFTRVLLPSLWPGLMTGFALAFARGLGEFGSVVFISGNIRPQGNESALFGRSTEIVPMLIVERLEAFEYAESTAIALVLLIGSLAALGTINWLERRSRRDAV